MTPIQVSETKKMDEDSKAMWKSLLEHTKNFQDRIKIYNACPELQPCNGCAFMQKNNSCTYKGGASKCGRW